MSYNYIPLDLKYLNRYFKFDFDTGEVFYAKVLKGQVGTVDVNGYRRMYAGGKYLYTHRVLWAVYHDKQPDVVDHINRDRLDNRIVNLRSVSRAENSANTNAGCKGIYPRGKRFVATYNGYLGTFDTHELALKARIAAQLPSEGN